MIGRPCLHAGEDELHFTVISFIFTMLEGAPETVAHSDDMVDTSSITAKRKGKESHSRLEIKPSHACCVLTLSTTPDTQGKAIRDWELLLIQANVFPLRRISARLARSGGGPPPSTGCNTVFPQALNFTFPLGFSAQFEPSFNCLSGGHFHQALAVAEQPWVAARIFPVSCSLLKNALNLLRTG